MTVKEKYLPGDVEDGHAAFELRTLAAIRMATAAATEAVRHRLIENIRRMGREMRGKVHPDAAPDQFAPTAEDASESLLALYDAFTQLAAVSPEAASVFELRFFAGHTLEEIAASLGISIRTASRHWTYAKAWLHIRLSEPPAAGG